MNIDTHGSDDKEWVGFDLDGTLAEYDGWKGVEHIGKPVERMVLVARLLHWLGIKIKIVTARVAPRDDGEGGEKARKYIEEWCRDNLGFTPEITYEKDAAMAALFDDRAVAVEQNTGKVLGGWTGFLPKASEKAKKAVLDKVEKKAEGPSNEDLRRMYDIVQADARLSGRIKGLGFGDNGDAYRKAYIKLHVMELARALHDGRRIRNRIVHNPGYIPSEMVANRALKAYADAGGGLDRVMGSNGKIR